MGFKHGVFATAFSVRAAFNWTLERIVWSDPQVDAEMIQSNVVDIFLSWILSCIHSLEIVFGDCSIFCDRTVGMNESGGLTPTKNVGMTLTALPGSTLTKTTNGRNFHFRHLTNF